MCRFFHAALVELLPGLAVHLDKNRGHIPDVELGKREVGIITLRVIARGFDATMAKLPKGR